MKRILVPCDFSAPSIEALKFAANIARRSKGEIILFHLIELPTLYDSSMVLAFEADFMRDTRAKTMRALENLKSKYAGSNVRAKIEVDFGGLFPFLKAAIKKYKADLIVMGTYGANGLKEYTVGSNAEKIVRNSEVPVICVKKAPSETRNIVFPVRPDLDQEELTLRVKELQDLWGANLHMVYINTPARFKPDFETQPLLEKFAKRYMLKNCTINIFSDSDEALGIINFTKQVKGDVVMMRTHGRKGITHLATGSIAEDVVNHISCPVWTYKIK